MTAAKPKPPREMEDPTVIEIGTMTLQEMIKKATEMAINECGVAPERPKPKRKRKAGKR